MTRPTGAISTIRPGIGTGFASRKPPAKSFPSVASLQDPAAVLPKDFTKPGQQGLSDRTISASSSEALGCGWPFTGLDYPFLL